MQDLQAPGNSQWGGHPSQTPVLPVEDFHIVAVEWLDGTDTKVIGDCDQYVNLPQDAKWLGDSDISNIDRLGISPRFRVRFDRPVSGSFKWRVVPVGGDASEYSGAEKKRNAKFVPGKLDWTSASTCGDGTVIMVNAAQLVAGGGYKFKVEAKDHHGAVVSTGVITTKRLFWYSELPMLNLSSVLSSTGTVEAEFAKHHLVMKQLADLAIPHQQNIGSEAEVTTLKSNISAAVAGNPTAVSKAPYLLRVAYTDHLAVKNPSRPQRVDGVKVGPGAAAVKIPVSSTGLRDGDGEAPRWLWSNLVNGEGWFVSAKYMPSGRGAAVILPANKVSMAGDLVRSRSIEVDVSDLPAGVGTLIVNVNVVDRMRGGLAFGGTPNICICTRAWWNTVGHHDQACTVVHEMGHQVHMVVDGSGNQPDRVTTQYDKRGHVGSHCHNGCASGQEDYSTSDNVKASTCVMFGTVNGKVAFCGNCAPAMKKVDLSAGF